MAGNHPGNNTGEDCIQKGTIKKLQDAVESLPQISAQLGVATEAFKEVASLMRESAANQSDIRHLSESDKAQWKELRSLGHELKRISEQPGKFALQGWQLLLGGVGTIVTGIIVGFIIKFW